jgi:hypothetical protein
VKRPYLPLAAFLLITLTASLAAAFPGNSPRDSAGDSDFTPLHNNDILMLVERQVDMETIIKAIKSSPCTFDTFPPILREMKRRGVPEAVLQAMVEAPYGPAEIRVDDLGELAQQPIYHYIEQLNKMGFLTPTTSGRRRARQSRVRASRPRQRS